MPENIPEQITLKTGESTEIKLKGLATAGYEWNYTIDGNKDCIDISKDFKLDQKLTQQTMGASANEIFTVTANKKGTVTINFNQKRSWEKNADPFTEKKVKIIIE